MDPSPRRYRPRIVDDELDALMASLPAVAVEGAKAVGKTATASRRATRTYQLDDPAQRAIVEADPRVILTTPGTVLIDEWQYVPAIWDQIRRAVDAGAPPGRYLLTGSASPAGTGTHTGGGRIVSLRMRPLSLAERGGATPTISLADLLSGERPTVSGRSRRSLLDYAEEIIRSGFPGLRSLSGRPLRAQLDGYLQRIVDRDFEELGHTLRDPASLRRWMAAYAAATATVASFEAIRAAATSGRDRKPAKTTVLPYLEILERLFVIEPLPAWVPSRRPLTELSHPPKHHLADPALAARLVGATTDSLLSGASPGPPIPRDGPFLGALFESLVTLSVRVYAQASEASVKHLRTYRGEHEVDLIIERTDGRIVAAQVSLGRTPNARSIRQLSWLAGKMGEDLLDSVVVTTGPEAYRRPDGIAVVPADLLGP